MSEWAAYCAQGYQDLVRGAVDALDRAAELSFARSADELRRMSSAADPGTLGFVVGPVLSGVSDVNLAAAIADGGNARCVVLACEAATGSLRSRAARAGIDLVVDLPSCTARAPEGPDTSGAVGAREPSAASPVPPAEGAATIVFCSGRGGAGKTTLASCAAVVASRWGLRTCLVDLDLSCGNAYAGFGLACGGDLASLDGEAPADALSRLAVSAAPGVSVVGPCGRPELAELASPLTGAVIAWAREAYDLVVIDTSTTFTDAVAQAVQGADRLVLVTDGRAGSVSALARMSGLAVRLGVARARIARLENRSDPRGRGPGAPSRPEVGLEAARSYRVVDGGEEVDELMSAGRVRELCEPGYPFSDSVSSTLAQLLAELGCLPDCEEARGAYGAPRQRRRRGLFWSRREAS